jgi:hypothetical protein
MLLICMDMAHRRGPRKINFGGGLYCLQFAAVNYLRLVWTVVPYNNFLVFAISLMGSEFAKFFEKSFGKFC